MTVEQRAEEYVQGIEGEECVILTDRAERKEAFIDGYNECQKEHEWHYVKNELPPEDVPLLCVRGGDIYVAWLILGKWKNSKYSDVNKPYAWREIVLPEEIE